MRTLVVVSLAAAGCSGGGGSSPAGKGAGITVEDEGGIAVLAGSGFSTQASVGFYTSVEPPISYFQPFGDGSCALESPNPTPTPAFTYLDAGPSVTFTTGTASVAIPRSGSTYDGYLGSSPLDAGYTLANAGSAALAAQVIASAHLGSAPVLTAYPQITAGAPVTVSFTADTGASFINLEIYGWNGQTAVTYRCNAPDTGTFTVPAEVTAQVGTAPSFKLTATTLVKTEVGGRNFYFEADACKQQACCATLQ